MDPRPVSFYARALRAALPAYVFAAEPRRAAWLALHLALAAAGIGAIGAGIAWPLRIVVALVVGHSFAGMAFVAHEILHGAVVRDRRLRKLLGGLAFLPMAISPTIWIAWHNRMHHGHAGQLGVDPDVCMTLDEYRARPALRWLNCILPGRRRWAGALTLFFGLSGQWLVVLLSMRSALGLSARERRQVVAETLAAMSIYSAVAVVLGPAATVLALIVPFFVANAILTSYILTNHALSPLT